MKYKPRQVKKPFSDNSERRIFTDKEGDYLAQSYLNGRYTYYDKNGNPKKKR